MTRPTVALASLGGTVTMTSTGTSAGGGPGVVPTLGAAELVGAVPALAEVADLDVETLLTRPGASLVGADLARALAWAAGRVRAGAAGVVMVQGTDTLEETSWLLDLWWDDDAPLVLTGAMRHPTAPGAEGPDNLLTAVRAAADPATRGAGCLVAMDGLLHAGSRVRKSHATALAAFTSPDTGPVGGVHEGTVWARPRARHPALSAPDPSVAPARVGLLETHLDDDGQLLRTAVEAGYDAVVVAAFGAGHVSATCAEAITAVLPEIPVLVASRTGGGATLSSTYGFDGSESDLARRGAILCGWLDARRSRGLAWSVLSAGGTRDDLAREVRLRGGAPG